MNVAAAAPILMAQAAAGDSGGCTAPVRTMLAATPGNEQVTTTRPEIPDDPSISGYNLYYDQTGKAQFVADINAPPSDTYIDTGLTNGREYCCKLTPYYDATCESPYSNVICATPHNQGRMETDAAVTALELRRYETQGKGKNKTTTFVVTDHPNSVLLR